LTSWSCWRLGFRLLNFGKNFQTLNLKISRPACATRANASVIRSCRLENLVGCATLCLVSALALSEIQIEVGAVRDLDLGNAEDREIFDAARKSDVVVVTKDRDFVDLLERYGPPPKIVWVTCGNTSNARMRSVLAKEFASALELLNGGESLVELTDLGET